MREVAARCARSAASGTGTALADTRVSAVRRGSGRARVRSRTGAVGAALAVLAHCACLVAFAGAAAAEDDAAKQLAERYAPIVVTPPKAEPCGKAGESFRPVPVDVVLGNPQVTLREKSGAEVKTAPTAADLYGLGDDYYLDFPGNSLKPRCDYERWFNQSAAGVPTTV